MINPLLEHTKCELCGDDKPVIIYPSSRSGEIKAEDSEFRSSGDQPLKDPLVRCGSCGFQYVTPRLSPAIVMDGYVNAVDETFVSQARSRERTFARCLCKVQKYWKKPPGHLLDVGTANGSFLKVAKDAGWQVAGCEPNRWMCKWSKDHYNIEVKQGTLFDGNYGDEVFDVVTLWDVLEHTPYPMETLNECRRVLRPGGLLIVNYPDVGSWIARAMGKKWVFLLSVHYFYFSRPTIQRALQKAGLEIAFIGPHFQSLEIDYILFRARPYARSLAIPLTRFVSIMRLNKLQIPYWIGQTIVIAKKNKG
jgi:SAM-dependent methyltransferase